MTTLEITTREITDLALDHPGANDPVYRARRDALAALARTAGDGLPAVAYTDEEHATWRHIARRLRDVHEALACRAYREARGALPLSEAALPDLGELSAALQHRAGFRLAVIPGLVDSRTFLSRLGERVMSCTQYIRHASRPEYTPEPDVVHEVLGHVPLFCDPDFAALSAAIGRAAEIADEAQMVRLERLYWFTLEFGLVEERGGLRAYGAGLLSSFGELPRAISGAVAHRPFDAKEVAETPFDFSRMQDVLFVVPSLPFLRREVENYLAGPAYAR